MKTFFLFAVLISTQAFASYNQAPPSFNVPGGKAVYVDFTQAQYNLVYDLKSQTATAQSTIDFQNAEEGFPIFDLVSNPTSVNLDGKDVTQELIQDPDHDSKLRLVKASVTPGQHRLVILSTLTPTFDSSGVRQFFSMTDLNDRGYLERYLPANLEFDQVPMTFTVEVLGLQGQQDFFTNGKVSQLASNKWQIQYPEYFTTSSLFFHTAPLGYFKSKEFTIASMDGRLLPARVYGENQSNVDAFVPEITKSITGLEKKYGAWRHPGVIVYASSSMGGGMEYSGGTVTALWALNHELTHSYFARGVMPANGNAGWIDEAVTTWSDQGTTPLSSFSYGSTGMGGHTVYRRYTDDQAYSAGRDFMAYLDNKFRSLGGLNAFLNKLLATSLRKTITTPELEAAMSSFYGQSLLSTFENYIYRGGMMMDPHAPVENPYHPRLTEEQMRRLN